jgi:hypothetical protein
MHRKEDAQIVVACLLLASTCAASVGIPLVSTIRDREKLIHDTNPTMQPMENPYAPPVFVLEPTEEPDKWYTPIEEDVQELLGEIGWK